ncbi:hypothetical protein NSK_005311 [Nannochloropsis salina CCMP1776]|uniref:inorganic diphosphatase n=1 Tax=Nannochloropsis salina CCMP1776 TaxID=1027361 RepID=A0A4D9D4B4_9STRA|nr:hypothetical protein NSK_005311 [Nannochloropsis salina CCMP1776]|eukprot:TFJ83379.1 hypothetical protein NSK_005311 [Nannochloropsis salina CCMP1776]
MNLRQPLRRDQYAPVYDIPIEGKAFPGEVPVFIEVSKGSRMKYEWDSNVGLLRLDRVLHSAVFYPFDYGCIVDVRVLGYMVMEDEKGKDEKVLAVLTKDPRMQEIKTLRDVPEHTLREISCFFEQYKVLEREKWVKVGGWKGTQDTYALVDKTHAAYFEGKRQEAAKAAAPSL